MTPEAQRITIAESVGYSVKECQDGFIEWRNPDGGYMGRHIPGVCPYEVPNYTTDLNAMHEAEKTLLPDLSRYGTELTKVCDQFAAENGYELLESWRTTATASQRAEAFLRTLNLWKE